MKKKKKRKKILTSRANYGLAFAAQKHSGQQGAVFQILCVNKTSTDPQDITYQVSVFISIIMLMLHMPQPSLLRGKCITMRSQDTLIHDTPQPATISLINLEDNYVN